ncbi:MAG: hypothetical protein KBS97_01335 [Firmicutes bacterium]|nr:hypothetical protein [Candidatus Fiminaster equi]
MKKSLLAFLFIPLVLGACTPANSPADQKTENEEHEQQHEDNDKQDEEEEEEEEHTQGDEKYPLDIEDYRPTNEPLSLDNWVNCPFTDKYGPFYADGWDFYHGDSHKPNGALWKNPSKLELSGIDFDDRNMFLISPNLESYKKVEVRLDIWFNHHTSDRYKATKNEPTFKIHEFDSECNLLNIDEVNFVRSNVPSSNTTYEKQFYIFQPSMSYFIIKCNNFIDNGASSYSAVITQISLKGWDYD